MGHVWVFFVIPAQAGIHLSFDETASALNSMPSRQRGDAGTMFRHLHLHCPMCHSVTVTPFRITLVPGQSIFEQVVFASTKAVLSGVLRPGQPFPSVRALAADLKIHPNTAHKVIQHLIQERWLEAKPGIGTVVAEPPKARPGDRKRLLKDEVEQLVVEARRVGAELEEVIKAIEARWQSMQSPDESEK